MKIIDSKERNYNGIINVIQYGQNEIQYLIFIHDQILNGFHNSIQEIKTLSEYMFFGNDNEIIASHTGWINHLTKKFMINAYGIVYVGEISKDQLLTAFQKYHPETEVVGLEKIKWNHKQPNRLTKREHEPVNNDYVILERIQ